MKSLFRLEEYQPGRYRVHQRGKLWGWNLVKSGNNPKEVWTTSRREEAESWIKSRIPVIVFRPRIVGEWFINGEQEPNGK